jgi:hypothetical protein
MQWSVYCPVKDTAFLIRLSILRAYSTIASILTIILAAPEVNAFDKINSKNTAKEDWHGTS